MARPSAGRGLRLAPRARALRRRSRWAGNGSRCRTGLRTIRPGPTSAGTARSRRGGAIDAFLDAELERLGLDDSRLALVGFSQGTMMALHVGLRRRRAPAAILGYSGPAGRTRAAGEATARDGRGRAAADPARPRRPGPAHPGRGDVHGHRGARAGVDSRPSGIFPSASATASTAAACATADCSSRRR